MNTIAEIRQALASQFPHAKIGLTATPEAIASLELLGASWLQAAVGAAELTFPGCVLELALVPQAAEPMINLNDKHANPGDPWEKQLACGLVVIAPHGAATTVRRMLPIPEVDLIKGAVDFKFVRQLSKLRAVIAAVYSQLYAYTPLQLDIYRQWRNHNTTAPGLAPFPPLQSVAEGAEGAAKADKAEARDKVAGKAAGGKVKASKAKAGGKPAGKAADRKRRDQRPTMWVAMHWFEQGGAEAWALEQLRIARAAGYRLVVTADRTAPQRMLAEVEALADVCYLPAHGLGTEDWPIFTRQLLARENISEIHIHHSLLAYATLPVVRALYPEMQVVDSTHILEHRGGGLVRDSVNCSNMIDLHHVISPQLRDHYQLKHGIAPEKVAYQPLTNFTAAAPEAPATTGALEHPEKPLRVGFLGRLAVQKRPYLFLEVARRVAKKSGDAVTFLMQGSGELETFVSGQYRRARLGEVVTRRAWGPTAEFFPDIDVLLITSENEGLTLTALEADAAGVLVVSADVGSQCTVTAPRALLSGEPVAFARQATRLLGELTHDRQLFAELLAQQHELVMELRGHTSAAQYFANRYDQRAGAPSADQQNGA